MIKAGVIGHPISHSLSPKLHQYWLKHYNIDGEYRAYDVAPEALADFITRRLQEEEFAGCNITIPHKEMAVSLVHHLDESARIIGAVNTILVRPDRRLIGMNTDAYGFAENIKPYVKNKNKAVMLGAGGAARAVIYALKVLGFKEIIITNRTQERAETVARGLGDGLSAVAWEQRSAALSNCDLLVNCTSLGLKNNPTLDIDLSHLPTDALVTDIVYNPLVTPLLAAAQARGNPIVDGLGMLLHQAAPGFEAWFGVKPQVTDALRAHIIGA